MPERKKREKVSRKDRVMVSFWIEPELRNELKKYAIDVGGDIQSVMEGAARALLQRNKEKPKPRA